MRGRVAAFTVILALVTAATAVAGSASADPGGPATRVCNPVTHPRQMSCDAMVVNGGSAIAADALPPDFTPGGYGPADLASAYALPTTGGGGATVAVVDAFNNPRAAADLAIYRSQYGLPACTVASGCFRQVNQDGSSSGLPANDGGWAGEESLDVDMVSAICPACHIILVEASSAADENLFRAEDEAVALGAKYVSNSWGDTGEQGQSSDDSHFNHPGVVITASTGDDGAGTQYPATSPYVTAVGGTSLRRAANARGWAETAWSDAGSGCSSEESKAAWQDIATNCSGRAEADVSAVADPSTGVAVYQSYGEGGWVTYGGTSVAAPVIAAVYALAGTPADGTYPASYPYADASDLFDVTSGSNGFCGGPVCNARTGWDGPTGLGTPDGIAAFTIGMPTPTPISTPTPTPIPTPTGGCVAAQLLGNPGFEAGVAAPWSSTPGVINDLPREPAHSGSWDAWLDGYGTTHTDLLTQTVTVPTGCTARLSFYLHIGTAEQTTTAPNDSLTVAVNAQTVATYSNLDHQPGYSLHTIPLTGVAGTAATITFTGTENDSLATAFVIDDTALAVG